MREQATDDVWDDTREETLDQSLDEVLDDPFTGQRLQIHGLAAGNPLVIDVTEPPGARTPLHVHPLQEERFTVTEGTLTVVVDGVPHTLGPGASLTIPAGVPHAIRTSRQQRTAMRWVTSPPGETRELMRALCALSTVRANGGSRWRHLLGQAAVLARHAREIRVLRPPPFLQSLLVALGGKGRAAQVSPR